eukprot:6631555-Prymnesium_polylepis.1
MAVASRRPQRRGGGIGAAGMGARPSCGTAQVVLARPSCGTRQLWHTAAVAHGSCGTRQLWHKAAVAQGS